MIEIRGASVSVAPAVRTFLGCGPPDSIPPSLGSDLEANILIIEDVFGGLLLVVSIDALYVGRPLRKKLEDDLEGTFTPDQIFLAASHSHNAPMLDPSKPLMGLVSIKHLTTVADTIVSAVSELLLRESEPVSVIQRQYRSKHTFFRRKKVLYRFVSRRKVEIWPTLMLPKKKLKSRPKSKVLEFRNRNDQLRAVLWVMPCHPVSHPYPDQPSSNFVGFVRAKTRQKHNSMKDMPFIFLQGASGDIRPPAISTHHFPMRDRLIYPGSRKNFSIFSSQDYQSWLNEMYLEFENSQPFSMSSFGNTRHVKPSAVSYSLIRTKLGDFFKNVDPERYIDAHCIKIDGFTFIGVSAEPTWSSIRWLLPMFGKNITLVGCVNDTYGYLASPLQYLAGGYEAKGFQEPFGLTPNSSSLATGLRIIRKLRENIFKALLNSI